MVICIDYCLGFPVPPPVRVEIENHKQSECHCRYSQSLGQSPGSFYCHDFDESENENINESLFYKSISYFNVTHQRPNEEQ